MKKGKGWKEPIFNDSNLKRFLDKPDDEPKISNKATVKGLITHWEKAGMSGAKIFLDEYEVFPDTWLHKIKTLIEDNKVQSAEEEIRLIGFNLDLKNKLYNPNIFKHGNRKDS